MSSIGKQLLNNVSITEDGQVELDDNGLRILNDFEIEFVSGAGITNSGCTNSSNCRTSINKSCTNQKCVTDPV